MNLIQETFLHIRSFSSSYWIVIAATLMNQIGNMAFVFLILYLTQHLGFSLTQASFAFAVFCCSTLFIGLLGGSLVDKLSPAPILLITLLANGTVLLTFPLLHTHSSILFMCFVWGLTYGLYRPASQTMIAQLSSPGLHRITFSVYRLALNLGMSIGPAIGGYLAFHSYPAIFIANGLANLLASVILIIGLSRSTWFHHRPLSEHKFELSMKWIKSDIALRIFLWGMVPICMIFYQHESTLPVFLVQDLHLPLSFYGWLFTINTLMIVFLELILNVAMMNWPYRVNFMLGSALITLGFSGFIFVTQAWHIILLTMIWTVGEMIFYPSASSYIAEIAPPAHRGSYMSLFATSSNLGMLLGPWAGAIIMQHFGANRLWIVCGVWGILSLLFFFYTREPNLEQHDTDSRLPEKMALNED